MRAQWRTKRGEYVAIYYQGCKRCHCVRVIDGREIVGYFTPGPPRRPSKYFKLR